MALSDEKKARLLELQQKRSEAEKAERDAAEERELEAEELGATLEAQGLKRGHDFAIINNKFGVFALGKPDTAAIRRWELASEKQKETLEWMIALLLPYILPKDKSIVWAQTCATRPGLCWQTGGAFVELMGVDTGSFAKK